jgi:lysophospholipase L1-like esterase
MKTFMKNIFVFSLLLLGPTLFFAQTPTISANVVSITPATVTVPVLGQQDFNGVGGVPPYAFIVTGDTTGGASVDFLTGLYTAGPFPGTTTVHMADSSLPLELTADALVTVQSGGGAPASKEEIKSQKKLAKAEKKKQKKLAKIQKKLAKIQQKLATHANNPKKVSSLNRKKAKLLAQRDKIQPNLSISVGDFYVALGDSITRGVGDFDMSDNTSQDGQTTGGGYPPVLADFLLAEKGYSPKIVNEGVEGETALAALFRLPGVLAKYPTAQFYLIQYGTNDAYTAFPLPSGLGLNPGDSGYPGSFKDTMQRIIDLVKNQGKTPLLGLMLYTPLSFLQRSFRNYNRVITGYINDPGLIASNGIAVVPPDFYAHFKTNPQQLNSDGLHPTGAGYRAMGDLWCGALIGLPFPSTCSAP